MARYSESMGKRRGTRVFAITSGKGGVGKSHTTANLAVTLSQAGFRVVAVDLDLGLANLDLLLGVEAEYNLSHVINGMKSIKEILIPGPSGVVVVPGANGIEQLANLDKSERDHLIQSLMELERSADIILLDTGAGIQENVIKFCRMADDIIVIAMPEHTSVTDAYATIKLINAHPKHGRIHLLINMGDNERDSLKVADGLCAIAKQYLELDINVLGWIKDDPTVGDAMKDRQPYVLYDERCDAARCLRRAVENISPRVIEGEGGSTEGGGFFQRVLKLFQ